MRRFHVILEDCRERGSLSRPSSPDPRIPTPWARGRWQATMCQAEWMRPGSRRRVDDAEWGPAVDRLSVLCFGGTYGLALACDLARFVVRGQARWYATMALTTLAWVVQTAYLGNLAHQTHQLPVSTVSESLLVLSWVLAAVALYLIVRSPKPVAVGV